MHQYSQLPRTFAILRTNHYHVPRFQILTADYNRFENYHMIEDMEDPGEIVTYRVSSLPNRNVDENIYKMRFRNRHTQAIMDVNYWYLPFNIRYHDIPIIEFQYRAWIPRPAYDLRVELDIGMSEIMRVTERIQEQRLDAIRMFEDSESMQRPYLPMYGGPDDYDDRYSSNTPMVGVSRYRHRQPEVRVVEVEVPVERIVVQTKAPPLPKSVGDILLANARKGSDSCPIAALAYTECKKLTVTSCFHIFDFESLSKWQETHATCPVCRAKIENVVSE